MDWSRFKAAAIRFFWASVFPLIGWFAVGQNLESIGVPAAAAALIAAIVGGALYFVKKFVWPDTTL